MKVAYTIAFLFLVAFAANAQNGLEKVIVEKYYITNADDAANEDGGKIPENSVTYRVYLDLLPGYIFQSSYALQGLHQMKIVTTTKFFNNEDRGAEFPTYSKAQAANNTVMLDTWLTAGAACKDNLGVLKIDDNGINTVVNKDDILNNDISEIGIPLTEQDGMITGTVEAPVQVGLSNKLILFGSSNDMPAPHEFVIEDGAWASLSGAKGVDTVKNHVLIGQFTTDGDFSFELNVQIRRESDKQIENYVAKDPVGNEIFEPTLFFNSKDNVATSDLDKDLMIKIYPNPSHGTLYFKLPENTQYSNYFIFDIDGREIRKGLMYGLNQNIDISELRNGVYTMGILISDKMIYNKIVKI